MREEMPQGAPGLDQGSVESPIELRKAQLKQEFLPQLEEALFNEHLTVEQLEALAKHATGSIDVYDTAPIDWNYLEHFSEDRSAGGLHPIARGLRGPMEEYSSLKDVSLSQLAKNVFMPIQQKGLKSALKRHDDGLRVDSVGLTGSDFKKVIGRVLERTRKLREDDVEQNYDKEVLRSFIKRYDNPQVVKAVKNMFDYKPDLRAMTIGELARKGFSSKDFPEKFQGSLQEDRPFAFIQSLSRTLGPDIPELSAGVLDDMIREEMAVREEKRAEKAAERGNSYEI